MEKTLAEWLAMGEMPPDGAILKCGREGCQNTYSYNRRSRRKYCSVQCKERAAKHRLEYGPKRCVVCGREFVPENPNYVACPGECRILRLKGHHAGLDRKPPMSPDEEQKHREHKRLEKQIREGVGRTAILCELLRDYIERYPANAIGPSRISRRAGKEGESMVLLRSDLHPGLITPSYNIQVFHERMEKLTRLVVRIKDIISESIPIEELIIFDLGDMVSGQGIYDGQAWQADRHVLEQVYHEAAPVIVAQNLTWLEHFPRVIEYSVPGNHGRTGYDFPDAVNWDNVVAQEVAARLEKVRRYEMHIEWGWWQVAEIRGWKFLLIHGHQIRSWLNIPFYGLVQKGMRWQGSMPERWDYLCHGHFHVPFRFPWNNFEIVGNGSLVSDDDFALRQLGMAGRPAQQVFGVHEKYGLTWSYTLWLEERRKS